MTESTTAPPQEKRFDACPLERTIIDKGKRRASSSADPGIAPN
jgi:hypothetical protein